MAWWKRSKSDANPPGGPADAPTTPLPSAADVTELWRAVRALQGALEDLDDRSRRFQARARKRWSVDEPEDAAPADGAARSAPHARNGRLPSPAELRANGRWPLR